MNQGRHCDLKSTTVSMKDNYEYHQSGEMKTVDNDVASKFDNLFKYDFAGRTKAARSAVEAGGSTETDLTQLPFRQDFGYDAFNHMTEFEGTRWTDVEDEPHTYTNNRKTGGTYDDDGRDISSRSIDAAGAVIWQYGANDVASTRYYQGDGQEIKRGYSYYDAELEEMTEPKHAYFIHSSVLNTVVSEANETGKKTQTFVLADGAIVALQKIAYPSVTEYVIWEHRDAGDTQVAYTDASGAPAGGVGWSAGNYDAIGRQTGSMAFVNPAPAQKPISPFFESPEQLGGGLGCQVMVDGILESCSMVSANAVHPTSQHGNKLLAGHGSSGTPLELPGGIYLHYIPGRDRENVSQPSDPLKVLEASTPGRWVMLGGWGLTQRFARQTDDEGWARKLNKNEIDRIKDNVRSHLTPKCRSFIKDVINNLLATGGELVSDDIETLMEKVGWWGYNRPGYKRGHSQNGNIFLPISNRMGSLSDGKPMDFWSLDNRQKVAALDLSFSRFASDSEGAITTIHELIHAAIKNLPGGDRLEANAALKLTEEKFFIPEGKRDEADSMASSIFQDRLAKACGGQGRHPRINDFIRPL